jgi:hypothetical protein
VCVWLGVAFFLGGKQKGSDFWEIIGKRVPIFEPRRENKLCKMVL